MKRTGIRSATRIGASRQSGGAQKPDRWRQQIGNALALAKQCGPQSVMSTAFALHSLPAQRHDANPPVTPPRHAVAG